MPSPTPPLRVTTWLAPSLPLALFERLAERIGGFTGLPVELTCDTAWSGPRPWVDDPFARGAVDVGFLCAPSWSWLAAGTSPSVVPVPALPVPLDPRAAGRPVYFSDVIVPTDGVRSFADLAGGTWAYNDSCSLSGWFALTARIGDPRSWFRTVTRSGSHLASIQLVAAGRVDGACIDSIVLDRMVRTDPGLAGRIRIVESWGPHPIQPVVARAGLAPATLEAVTRALLSFSPGRPDVLAPFGLAGFVAGQPGPLPVDVARVTEAAARA